MKTGRKISLIYSGITIGLIIIAGVVFYFFASNYVHSLYFHYLEEKAHAVAEEKFSKDELDPVKYQNVVLRRKNSIPTSQELFIRIDDRAEGRRALHEYFSDKQIDRLYHNETVDFTRYDESGTAFVYYDNTGTFAVIVLSKDSYVEAISSLIRWTLLVLVLVAAGVLWLISKLYAMRVLDRIDKDYQAEKMFVNNASHEINNPLTAIQGECEIALIGEHSREDYQDTLRRISHETDRIITIMRELLMFSHAKYGDIQTAQYESVRVSELFAQSPAQVHVIVKEDFMLHTDKDLLYCRAQPRQQCLEIRQRQARGGHHRQAAYSYCGSWHRHSTSRPSPRLRAFLPCQEHAQHQRSRCRSGTLQSHHRKNGRKSFRPFYRG